MAWIRHARYCRPLACSAHSLLYARSMHDWYTALGAANRPELTITVKDHKFDPAQIEVPASKPVVLKHQEPRSEADGIRKQHPTG